MSSSIIALILMEEEEEERLIEARMRKQLRDSSNPLALSDSNFRKLYRLNKDAFLVVLNEINSHLKKDSIPNIIKLAATLRFLAEGGHQASVANDRGVGLARSTFSKILTNVLDVMEDILCRKWIKLKMTEEEINECKQYFYEKFNFPGVIGCVDSTHISIIKPREHHYAFYNPKNYHSINAMIICDHKQKIRYVDATHGGQLEESLIWIMSEARSYLQRYANKCWILGDSGFSLDTILMTPYRNPEENSKENRYNTKHKAATIVMKRTIEVLKNRFRCLTRQLNYTPLKCSKIFNACCALHNICKFYNVSEDDLISDGCTIYETEDESYFEEEEEEEVISAALEIRESIANTFLT